MVKEPSFNSVLMVNVPFEAFPSWGSSLQKPKELIHSVKAPFIVLFARLVKSWFSFSNRTCPVPSPSSPITISVSLVLTLYFFLFLCVCGN